MRGRGAVAAEARVTSSGKNRQRAARSDGINDICGEIGNVEEAIHIDGHVARLQKLCVSSRDHAASARDHRSASRHRLNRAIDRHFAHARIAQISDVDIA